MTKLKQKTEYSTRISKLLILMIILTISIAAVGVYYEWTSAIVSILLTAFLAICYAQEKKLHIPKGWVFAATVVVMIFFGVSTLWAADKGMAIFGMVKFLPVPLFIIALCQISEEEREKLLNTIPVIGAAVAIVSFLGFIPALHDCFFVGDRFFGTWQYPNSFALLLLVGIIIILSHEKLRICHYLIIAVSIFAIAISGSRTTFILLALTMIWFLFSLKNKWAKFATLGMFVALIAGTVIYVAATGNVSSIGRFLTTSLNSSTLVGRFLYFKDALPVIASHPLGLGYMGYHFAQGSFQTGVYSVMNVHNELLQLLVDVGWIPTAVCIAALFFGFKRADRTRRLIIIAIVLHSMLDFDLQFVAMAFVLVLAMFENETRKKPLRIKNGVFALVMSMICIFSAYFGIANGLYCMGKFDSAARLYPGYTTAEIQLLQSAEDTSDMERIANDIIRKNDSTSIAYSAKARVAFSKGDFTKVISYKERAIELSKYALDEYIDYYNMLVVGYQMYIQSGDIESAEYCRQRILSIPDMLSQVLDGTSPLAWEITDKPELTLPDEVLKSIESIK